MKRLFAALFLIALVGFWLFRPSVLIRYRLDVQMEWNGQSRTGSGVVQVIYNGNIPFLGSRAGINSEVMGEAVSVDLGPDDTLFVLLKDGPLSARSGPENIIPNLFGVAEGGFGPEDFPRISAIEGRRDVPLELLPLMVRLRNVKDPKSAVLFVPPGGQPPNQDLVLKRAAIEIVSPGIWPLNQMELSGEGFTGVPVTRGIEQKLPWLKGFTGYTGGQFGPNWSQPEKNLTGNDFIQQPRR